MIEPLAAVVEHTFGFLEGRGFARCQLAQEGEDPRDTISRVRYVCGSSIVDIQMAVGLGLFAHVRQAAGTEEATCDTTTYAKSINVEDAAPEVQLPRSLRFRGSNTLYDAYNRNALAYHNKVQRNVPLALSYLAEKVKAVLDGEKPHQG